MSRATDAFHNRIALVFDFDQTLAPDSFDALLHRFDVDPDAFREEHVHPLDDAGWDHSLARCHALVELSNRVDGGITEAVFHEVGQSLGLFDGLPDAFDEIRRTAQNLVDGVEVEFYVLTAGYAEIVNGTPLKDACAAVWGSAFQYGPDGRIVFPKRIVTYAEKVRYLMALSRGMSVEGHDAPSDVWRPVDDADLYVPLDQLVYVGDGSSDLPAFNFMEDSGGIAIGVTDHMDAEEWKEAHAVHRERRVQNLAPATYTGDSELYQSLCLSVESIAKLIALRQLSEGE